MDLRKVIVYLYFSIRKYDITIHSLEEGHGDPQWKALDKLSYYLHDTRPSSLIKNSGIWLQTGGVLTKWLGTGEHSLLHLWPNMVEWGWIKQVEQKHGKGDLKGLRMDANGGGGRDREQVQ